MFIVHIVTYHLYCETEGQYFLFSLLFRICLSSAILVAVSYTHLDVYKRQIQIGSIESPSNECTMENERREDEQWGQEDI